jgi:cytosolic prostaglandin-E synthase
MNTTHSPNIKWAERKDKLYVTIELNDVKNPTINLTEDNRIVFSGSSQDKEYALDLELFGEINRADSKWTLDTRNIFLNIKKAKKGTYWNYINKDKKKYNYIHVDWNLYIEEDDEDVAPEQGGFPGMGGMGNNFMDMQNMGGMGDMMGGEDMMDEDDVKEDGLGDLDKEEGHGHSHDGSEGQDHHH